MEHLETSKDEDAKTGHKTADTSFWGYKTHIAMTEERIITAATITSGDCQNLYKKVKLLGYRLNQSLEIWLILKRQISRRQKKVVMN